MRLTVEAKKVSPGRWLATLTLSEPGKVSNVRYFIVDEQQLAFLNLLDGMRR